jgi:hypothetical protein
MKKFFILFCLAAAIASCKKEDSCATEDFVGTWKGKEVCTLLGTTDVTIEIVKNGSKLDVSGGSSFGIVNSEIDNCSFEGGVSVLGVGEKLTGSLSGSTLSMTYKNGVGVVAENCTYTLTK